MLGVMAIHTIVGVMAMRQERCTSKYVSFETTCLLRRQVSGLEDMSLVLDIISVTKYARLFFDGYCSTVQGLLDWFEVDLGFTELSFIQIDLCVLCVFFLYSRVSLSSVPFWTFCTASPARWECL